MRVLILESLWVLSLIQLSTQTVFNWTSSEDICQYFGDGTTLRKPGTCNEWVICQDSKSTEGGVCTGTTSKFALDKAACKSSLDSWDKYCNSPCTTKTSGYISDTRNCENWYYCDGKTLKASGTCNYDMYFDQEKQLCVYPKDANCQAVYEFCNVTPTGVKIPDFDYCNKYYTCKSGSLVSNECEDGLYFDASTSSCIRKSLVNCEIHPLPQNVCGTTKLAKRNKFVSDGATCRGYYYCHDLGSGNPDPEPTWNQCPLSTFFEETRQACFESQNVKCLEDRCDGIEEGLILAENHGCQHYLECTNGVSSDPIKCEDDMYFDEPNQKCVPEVRSYIACTD